MGTVFELPVVETANLVEALQQLRRWPLVGKFNQERAEGEGFFQISFKDLT
jgi:hypothetical protein